MNSFFFSSVIFRSFIFTSVTRGNPIYALGRNDLAVVIYETNNERVNGWDPKRDTDRSFDTLWFARTRDGSVEVDKIKLEEEEGFLYRYEINELRATDDEVFVDVGVRKNVTWDRKDEFKHCLTPGMYPGQITVDRYREEIRIPLDE